MIQEAWIGGVSTRRVDELVQAMGLSGIGKPELSDDREHVLPPVGTSIEAAQGMPL